jgi:hypothetical protein
VRNQEWDPALAKLNSLDLAELVLGLLSLDTVHGETTLGVVDETEVLAGLLDADDVHETSGVGRVSADLAVDLDQALHHDSLGLTAVQGVLETVADEDDQGQAVTELVRTGGGLGSIGSGHFVQEPVRGRTKALLVLLTIGSRSWSVSSSSIQNSVVASIAPCFARTIPLSETLSQLASRDQMNHGV